MTALSAIAMLLRRIQSEGAILLLLVGLIAATSFLFAAAPRHFNRVTDEAVRYAVQTASVGDRDVFLHADGRIQPGTDPGVTPVQKYGELRQGDLPPSIANLISGRFARIGSVRFAVPQTIVAVSLAYQDGLIDASRLTAGRWPADRGMPLTQIRVGDEPAPVDESAPAIFEVALSSAQAEAMGAHVGDRVAVGLDGSDPFVPKSAFAIAPTQLEVVGVYEPIDAAAAIWAGSGLAQPAYKQGPDGIEAIYATALVAPEAYPSLAASLLPFRYEWHFSIDPGKLDAENVFGLQTALQRLDLVVAPTDNRYLDETSSIVGLTSIYVGSGLLRVVDGFIAQRARTESVVSIAALGLLGLAAGAVAMIAILLVRRRRGSLLLARGRGASGTLLMGAQLLEAVVLAGTASLVGLLIAVNVVPARDAPLSLILVVAVAVAATLALVAASWPLARRPLIQLDRDDAAVLNVPARRLVLEATIVGIAVVAVALLRQRGLTLGPVGDTATFDPLLSAVPLLSGLAAGIVVMRLYPLPVRALGRLAARRRDFVPVVGLRTVARHPASSSLPLLVLMLTAAFAAFASVVGSSIERGQVAASYVKTGADYRLEEVGIGGLPPSLDPSTIPGVQAVASGVVDGTADLVTGPNKRATVDFDAVDVGAYAAVTSGTAADPAWPRAFFAAPSGADVGTDANPIPAILSSRLPAGLAGLAPGGTFNVGIEQRLLTFRLVGRQDDFPGHGSNSTFAIVPLDWVREAVPETTFFPTVMWVRASTDAAGPLATMVSGAGEQVRIVARQDAYGVLHDAPLGSAVASFFGLSLAVAVVYMAVTLVGAVIVSAAGHTRDLAYLRSLGVSRRQAQALTAVEHAPPILLALVPGVLLGVAVALLVEPGLGLADFIGAQGVPLFIDWATLALVIACLSLVVAIAILAGTWLAGRTRLSSALRIGDS
jgi:putative ABC transport system permease protein